MLVALVQTLLVEPRLGEDVVKCLNVLLLVQYCLVLFLYYMYDKFNIFGMHHSAIISWHVKSKQWYLLLLLLLLLLLCSAVRLV